MVDSDSKLVDRLCAAQAQCKSLDDVVDKLHERMTMLHSDNGENGDRLGSIEKMKQTLEKGADSLTVRMNALESSRMELVPSACGSLVDAEGKKAELEDAVVSLSTRMTYFLAEHSKMKDRRCELEKMADSFTVRIEGLESGENVVVNKEKRTMLLDDVASFEVEALRSSMLAQFAESEKIRKDLEQYATHIEKRIDVIENAALGKGGTELVARPDDASVPKAGFYESLQRENSDLKKQQAEAMEFIQGIQNEYASFKSNSQKEYSDALAALEDATKQATQSQRKVEELTTCLKQQAEQLQQQAQDLQSPMELDAARQEVQATMLELRQARDETALVEYKNQLLLQEKEEKVTMVGELQKLQQEQQDTIMSQRSCLQKAEQEKQDLQQQHESHQAQLRYFQGRSEESQRSMVTAQRHAKEAKDLIEQEVVNKEKVLEENTRLRAHSDEGEETISKLQVKYASLQAENLDLNNCLNSFPGEDAATQLLEMHPNYNVLQVKYASLESEYQKLQVEATRSVRKESEDRISGSPMRRGVVMLTTSATLQAKNVPWTTGMRRSTPNSQSFEQARNMAACAIAPMQTQEAFRVLPSHGCSVSPGSVLFSRSRSIGNVGSSSTPGTSVNIPLQEVASFAYPTNLVASLASPMIIGGRPASLNLGVSQRPYF